MYGTSKYVQDTFIRAVRCDRTTWHAQCAPWSAEEPMLSGFRVEVGC